MSKQISLKEAFKMIEKEDPQTTRLTDLEKSISNYGNAWQSKENTAALQKKIHFEKMRAAFNSDDKLIKKLDDVQKNIDAQFKLYSKYKTADEYNTAVKNQGYAEKYKNRTYQQISDFIKSDDYNTMRRRGLIDESEAKWLRNQKYALGTSTQLQKELDSIEDLLKKAESIKKTKGSVTVSNMGNEFNPQKSIMPDKSDVAKANENFENQIKALGYKNVEQFNNDIENKKTTADILKTVIAQKKQIESFNQKWGGIKVEENYQPKINENETDSYYIAINQITPKALKSKTIKKHSKSALINDRIVTNSDYFAEMEPEEKNKYNKIYETKGITTANQYADDLISLALDKRLNEKVMQKNYDFTSKNGFNAVVGSIASVGESLGSGIEYVTNLLKGETDRRVLSATRAQGLREGTKSHWDSDVWDFVYDTTMSGIDSASGMALSVAVPYLGEALLGGSAAAHTFNNALDRGVPQGDAVLSSLAAGVAESLFEHVSIGTVLKGGKITAGWTKKGLLQATKKTLVDMGVNFSEETLTEISNVITDRLINGELSNYDISVRDYYMQGMSPEDAKRKAAEDVGTQIGMAGLSGMLMGFGFGTIGSTYGLTKSQMLNSKAGSNVVKNGEVEALKTLAKDSGIAEIQKAAEKIDKNSKPSKIGYVFNSLLEEYSKNSTQQLTTALLENGATERGSNSAKGWATQILKNVVSPNNKEAIKQEIALRVNKLTGDVYANFVDNGKYGGDALLNLLEIGEDAPTGIGTQSEVKTGNTVINDQGVEVPVAADGEGAAVGPVMGDTVKGIAAAPRSGEIRTITEAYKQGVAENLEKQRPNPKTMSEEEIMKTYFAEEVQISPEEEEVLKDFGKANGLEVEFVDGAVNGKGYGVFQNGKQIVISRYAKKPMAALFKHEFTHSIEKAKGYAKFQKYVLEESKAFKGWLNVKGFENWKALSNSIVKNYEESGVDYEDPYIKAKADIIADFVGDVLFGEVVDAKGNPIKLDTNFLVELKKNDRNLFQRFVEWVHSILKRLTTKGVVNKDIVKLEQKFKRLAEQARQQRAKGESEQSDYDVGSYSLPDLDADYLKAVENGDMETAQRMVDEAAKRAGYTFEGYHGTPRGGFTVFKTRLPGMLEGVESIFLSKDSSTASSYAHGNNRKVYHLFAKIERPLIVDCGAMAANGIWLDGPNKAELKKLVNKYVRDAWDHITSDITKASTDQIGYAALRSGEYDGVVFKTVKDSYYSNAYTDVYEVFTPEQVKSADPVTYDDDGNVIPLSERFKNDNNDIRYSLPNDNYAPTFYSKMGKTVDEMKQDKIGANSVVSYLTGRGVKSEEIKWSGIETFLEGKKSVTKSELQEFIAGSQLQIEEKVLDGKKKAHPGNLELQKNGWGKLALVEDGKIVNTYHKASGSWIADVKPYLVFDNKEDIIASAKRKITNPTHWENYTLDGGENYREVLFKMPNSTYTNTAMKAHWGKGSLHEDNSKGVLAHARLQDFDVDGKKMLFIEEIQSDWHNEGHKEGYDVVPDAPFKDNYHEYVLKSLLRTAAENGYDSIGWTPADVQSERWSDEFAEGYRIEYDQDMPKFLKKYGKQWGATVGSTVLNNGTEVWSMDITDQMKNSVLYEGQSLYSLPEIDNEGNKLSEGQRRFFDKSKLTDEQGNLLRLYHGTKNGGFTKFSAKYSDDGITLFLTPSRELAGTYTDSNDTVKLPEIKKGLARMFETGTDKGKGQSGIYEVYANAKKPYILDCDGASWNTLPFAEKIKGKTNVDTENTFDYKNNILKTKVTLDGKVYEKTFDLNHIVEKVEKIQEGYQSKGFNKERLYKYEFADQAAIEVREYYKTFANEEIADDLTSTAILCMELPDGITRTTKAVIDNKTGEIEHLNTRYVSKWAKENGYDAVWFKNVRDIGAISNNVNTDFTADVVVVFDGSQIKSVDNLEPTKNKDIRYSLPDIPDVAKGMESANVAEETSSIDLAPLPEDAMKTPTNRELISNALESIDTSTQAGQDEIKLLNKYLDTIDYIKEEEAQLSEVQKKLFPKGGVNPDSISVSDVEKQIKSGKKEIHGYEIDHIYEGKHGVYLASYTLKTPYNKRGNDYQTGYDMDVYRAIAEHIVEQYRKDAANFPHYAKTIARIINENKRYLMQLEEMKPIKDILARGKSNTKRRVLVDEGEITVDETLAEAINKYGTMPKGENPKVDVDVPNKVSDTKGVRRFARTALESGHLTEGMSEDAKREIINGALNYEISSNKMVTNIAEKKVAKDINKAIQEWEGLMASGKIPTAEDIALGEVLLVEAAKAGNANDVAMYLAEIAALGTQLGQGIQALSLLKKLTGVGQLHYVSRVIAQMNEDLKRRYGDKFQDVLSVDPNLEEILAKSKNQAEIEEVIDDILTDVAKQMPSTWLDKFNAWRYLAMLGNTRTHIRNFVGNAIFLPAIRIKDALGTIGERMFIKDASHRTKVFKVNKKYREYAMKDFEEVKGLLTRGGKMNPSDIVQDRRKIFTSKLFAPVEKFRKFNFDMLEAEDLIFLKKHYIHALGSVLQSRGLDVNNITEQQLKDARDYAINEAQKATYRDFSFFANMLNKLAHPTKNGKPVRDVATKGLAVLIEGALPFKKTPINILKRGIEYSPLGIATTFGNAIIAGRRGEFSGAEFIDGITSGMTGTMILGLGMLLQSMGWLVGGLGYDDEDALERLSGAQPYAIDFGDWSYTIDWMAPSSLPLLIGAEISKALDKEEGHISDLLLAIAEPMTELSFLQGVNDIIEGVAYSGENGLGVTGEVVTNLASTYVSQYFPTLTGQVARTFDDTRRANFVDKSSAVPKTLQKTAQKILGKIPFAENQKIPYIDAWGRTEENGNVLLRVFENFVSPGYVSKIEDDKVNNELAKVYTDTGESGVIPKKAGTSFSVNGKMVYLDAEKYVQYATDKGQYSRQYLEEMLSSGLYNGLSSDGKAEAIAFLFSYANAKAKSNVSDYDYREISTYKTAAKLEDAGISPASYAVAKFAMSNENADTDGSGSVTKSEKQKALRDAGFSSRDANKILNINKK